MKSVNIGPSTGNSETFAHRFTTSPGEITVIPKRSVAANHSACRGFSELAQPTRPIHHLFGTVDMFARR